MSITITKSTRILMAAATAFLTVGALTGCSIIDSLTGAAGTETRDEEGTVTEGGKADVFQIKVGDCFNNESSSAEEISDVPVVPCSEPHDNEIFFDFELTGDSVPAGTAMEDEILAQCGPAFNDFIGVEFNESLIEMSYIAPTAETWSQMDDRLVSCFVIDPDGQSTGSLKGANR